MTFQLPIRGAKNWDVTLNATLQDLNTRIAAGIPGVQGTQGVQGRGGVQGSRGPVGMQGVQGTVGAGVQGTTGAQGATGAIGPEGVQGVQGKTGVQGSQGDTGIQGTEGTQGSLGIQGSQGDTGAQGTKGEDGAQGVEGTSGLQGLQGVQGPTGSQGAQGTLGTQGIQGTQGVVGPAGTVTSFSSTWSGTGLAYTGTPTSGFYMQNGKFTSFYINVNCATVTNFGNVGAGYSFTLPVAPAHSFNTIVGQVTKSDGNVFAVIGKGTAGSTTMTMWTNEKNQKVMDKDSPYGAGGITTSTTFTLSGTYIAS